MKNESDGDIDCNWRARYSHERIDTGTGGLGNKRTNGDHPNNCIVEIGQNTKKSPGDLRRLAVTKNPMENYLLTLVRKTQKTDKYMDLVRKLKKLCNMKVTVMPIVVRALGMLPKYM